uniref:hypothetical protein n=1 Tax=Halomonas piscis TaxID=3031727 RepID=UPI00289E9CC1
TLRSLSRRWISLDEEAGALNKMIYDLVQEAVPQLVESYGISPAYSRGRLENEDGEWFSLVESGCSCQNTIQEDHSPWVKP